MIFERRWAHNHWRFFPCCRCPATSILADLQAAKHIHLGHSDTEGRWTVFGQAFRQVFLSRFNVCCERAFLDSLSWVYCCQQFPVLIVSDDVQYWCTITAVHEYIWKSACSSGARYDSVCGLHLQGTNAFSLAFCNTHVLDFFLSFVDLATSWSFTQTLSCPRVYFRRNGFMQAVGGSAHDLLIIRCQSGCVSKTCPSSSTVGLMLHTR